MTLWIITLTTAYLLGSIPFGYLLVRFVRQEDVRDTGSGNIGATNVARAGGTTLGIFTLLLDAMKGFIAVFLTMQFAPNTANGPSTFAIAAAVAAVVGHVFPVWLRFRGGKGIATALGVFIPLVPLVALASVGVFALIVAITRLVSLGSIVAAVSIPFLAILLVPTALPPCSSASASSPCSASSSTTPTSFAFSRARKAASAAKNSDSDEQEGQRMSRIAVIGAGAWGTALTVSSPAAAAIDSPSGRTRQTTPQRSLTPARTPATFPASSSPPTSKSPTTSAAPSPAPTSSSA